MALTCLDYITQAMRELRVLGSGATPTTNEAADGLIRLQAVLDGLFGNGVGVTLSDVEITTSTTLVANSRALVAATSALTLTFPETPLTGERMQVKDLSSNFATYNVTLNGNGRNIAGTSTVTLSTNGADVSYVYAADSANWVQVSSLASGSTLPLGDDEFFVLALAQRLAPMYGAGLGPDSQSALIRAANRIRAKFSPTVVVPADNAVRFLSRQSYTQGWFR